MSAPGRARLVVVSNRVALPRQTATRGLASALQAGVRGRGGLWFGGGGKVAAGAAGMERERLLR